MRWLLLGTRAPEPPVSKTPEPSAQTYNPADEPAPLGDVHRRGEAAHRLLNDPTLAEAFKELREDLYAEWLISKQTRREELWHEVHALERVTSKLIAYRASAKIRADTA